MKKIFYFLLFTAVSIFTLKLNAQSLVTAYHTTITSGDGWTTNTSTGTTSSVNYSQNNCVFGGGSSITINTAQNRCTYSGEIGMAGSNRWMDLPPIAFTNNAAGTSAGTLSVTWYNNGGGRTFRYYLFDAQGSPIGSATASGTSTAGVNTNCTTYDFTLPAITGSKVIKISTNGNSGILEVTVKTYESGTPPTVTTNTPVATAITSSSATLGGSITDAGTSPVSVSGFVYGLNVDPTIADQTTTDGGTVVGSISSNISDLSFSTTYHVRSYATSASGTSYGSDQTFITAAPASPTILTNPTSLSFGTLLIGNTSSEKTFTIIAGGLNTPGGNITIAAPTGYEVSVSSGSGFGSSVNVAFTGSGLTSTTIYVHFIPTTLVSYNGNITILGGGASASVSLTGSGSNVAYTVGDYGSVTSGNWGTLSTWKLWDGSGFNTVAAAQPTTADNVWVNSNDTVTVEASAKNCKNLYVNGRIKSNNKVNVPVYIKVYGTEINVGPGGLLGSASQTLGDAADGISIDYFGTVSNPTNPFVTITGGGTIGISRLRTNTSHTTVTIDNDVTLNYHGSTNSGNAAGYYTASGDTNIITINAGKTLTFAPWSCYTPVSSSHSNGGSTGGTMDININGTLTFMSGNAAPDTVTVSRIGWHPSGYMSLGTSKITNLTIGSTGTLNATEFYPNGTKNDNTPGTGIPINIAVADGGILNVNRIADFRNATQTAAGAGAFNLISGAKIKIGSTDGITGISALGNIQTAIRNFSTGATYAYEGIAAQNSGDGLPADVSGLIINNSTGLTLSNAVKTADSLNLTNGIIISTSAKMLTIGESSAVNGGSTTSHVSGPVTRLTNSTNNYSFPVGKGGVYHAATVNPTAGTISSYTVEYFNTSAASTSSTTVPLTSVSTSEYWDVIKNSGADARVLLNYDNTLTTTWSNSVTPGITEEIVVAHFVSGNWIDETSVSGTSISGSSTSGNVISQILSSFSPFTFGLRPAGTVPVNLISFNATLVNGQTKLYWSTNNEINIAKYIVEKSADAKNFVSIGSSILAANLSANNYSTLDASLTSGVSYYRLRITDKDGRSKYSNIIAINNKAKNVLNVFPNPVENNLFVSHSKATSGAKLKVYSIDGRKINEYQLTKDAVQTTINASALPKGTYTLVLLNGGKIQHIEFIKQ